MTTGSANVTVRARGSSVPSVWLLVVAPALALVYPWCVAVMELAAAPLRRPVATSALLPWVAFSGSALLVCAVPAAAVYVSYVLGVIDQPTRREVRARWMAHLACTAPSLLVAFGNYARILGVRTLVTPAWIVVWLAAVVAVAAGSTDDATRASTAVARRLRLRHVHESAAAALVILFLAPHVSNHVAAIWSGAAHIEIMRALRTVYRAAVIEPVLVALLVIQAASGIGLARVRVRDRSTDVFHTLQTTSGVYILVFLISHLAAALSARAAGTDPNWLWLVGRAGTLLAYPSLTVVPHYFLGPLALFVHVACGVRTMRLARARSRRSASRLAVGIIAVGGVASFVIIAALFGLHVRS